MYMLEGEDERNKALSDKEGDDEINQALSNGEGWWSYSIKYLPLTSNFMTKKLPSLFAA